MTKVASQIGFLASLRATACLLVVYCHLIGQRADPDWFVKPFINQFVRDPLAVIWDFGYLGVAIFFVISGFIITHVAQRETRGQFVLKRLFRIYPPFLVALAVASVLAFIVDRQSVSLPGVLREASLFDSRFILLGPSYTLVIEIMFYALATALLPLLRSRPVIATVIIAIVPVFIRYGLRGIPLSPPFARLLGYQNFVSVFAIGMAIYYRWEGRLSVRATMALGLLAWCAFVWTSGPSAEGRGFQINTIYAVAVFLAALWVQPRGEANPVAAVVAEGSYSLYLLHVPIGIFILNSLGPILGYSLALVIGLAVLALSCLISYRWIERPSQALGRLLIRRLRLGHLTAAHPAKVGNAAAATVPAAIARSTIR